MATFQGLDHFDLATPECGHFEIPMTDKPARNKADEETARRFREMLGRLGTKRRDETKEREPDPSPERRTR